nr:MAG TPA: hypothetical protein [Crassvirales sp.]
MQDAGQVASTTDTEPSVQLSKGYSPAPQQGCITILLSSGDNTPTPAHGNPCDQGNNAGSQANHQPDNTLAGGRGWTFSGYSPVYIYIFCS